MQLTYSHRVTTRMALLFAAMGLIALALAIWPPHRMDHLFLRAILVLAVAGAFLLAGFFVRLRAARAALSAEAGGLRINCGRGERTFAWRDIASIERGVRIVRNPRSAPVSVSTIEIVLRSPPRTLWSWPSARPIEISFLHLAQGEAAVDRWIGEARRRLGAGAPAYGLVPSTA